MINRRSVSELLNDYLEKMDEHVMVIAQECVRGINSTFDNRGDLQDVFDELERAQNFISDCVDASGSISSVIEQIDLNPHEITIAEILSVEELIDALDYRLG